MSVAWQKIGDELFEALLEGGDVVLVVERNMLAPPGQQFEAISMDVVQSVTLAVSGHPSVEEAKRAGEAWASARAGAKDRSPADEPRFDRADLLEMARRLREAHWQRGEINLTALAEEVAWTLGHSEWLDDSTHAVWEVVIEAAQEVGGLR
ncbi:MAG: hypothetical protein RLP09_20525 [Sandaracinaceae bacterium]